VEKAFEHLSTYYDHPERDVRFQVICGPSNSKGIHLRGGLQDSIKDCTVSVEPFFTDPDNTGELTQISYIIFRCVSTCCLMDAVYEPWSVISDPFIAKGFPGY
jgi:hypothetical protein